MSLAPIKDETLFTFTEAQSKLGDSTSGFILKEVEQSMALYPKYLKNVKSGLLEQLNDVMNIYSDDVKGVPVAYSGVKILRTCGFIDDYGLTHFNIRLKFIIYRPQPGNTLIGVVNKLSKGHVGCLIHGRFNASIPKLSEDGNFIPELNIGQKVELKVTSIHPHSGVLSVKGQYVSTLFEQSVTELSSTGQKRDLEKTSPSPSKPSSKRRKLTDEVDQNETLPDDDLPDISCKSAKRKKKDKKDKNADHSVTNGDDSIVRDHNDSADDSIFLPPEMTPQICKKHKKSKKKKENGVRDSADESFVTAERLSSVDSGYNEIRSQSSTLDESSVSQQSTILNETEISLSSSKKKKKKKRKRDEDESLLETSNLDEIAIVSSAENKKRKRDNDESLLGTSYLDESAIVSTTKKKKKRRKTDVD